MKQNKQKIKPRKPPWIKPLLGLCDFLADTLRLMFYPVFDQVVKVFTNPPGQPAPAIMVVRLDAIGDYLLFRPLLTELKKSDKFKGRQLILCGNAVWRELAEQFDAGVVDRFIWLDRHQFERNPLYRYRKIKELRATTYETALNPTFTRNLWFDDRVMSLVSAHEKIGSVGDPAAVMGWRKKIGDLAYDRLLPARRDIMLDLYRNQEFFQHILDHPLTAIPHPALPILPRCTAPRFPAKPYAILFAGASADYKKWPLSCFFEVGEYLMQHHQLEVLIAGGPDDAADFAKANLPWPVGLRNLCGKTTLLETVALVQHAAIMVSNETMAPHIAALSGTPPCVVVSCTAFLGRFYPYPDKFSNYHIVYHPEIAEDLAAFQRISNQPGYYNTLDIAAISPAVVIPRIETALVGKKKHPAITP